MDAIEQKKFREDLHEVFRKYKSVDREEFSKILANEAVNYKYEPDYQKPETNRMNLSENDRNDLNEFWSHMIKEVIMFLNEHPEIMKLLNEEKEKMSEQWSDIRHIIEPDIRFSLYADGLDESIKQKEWTPFTDSTISLFVGNQPVISMF